MNEFEQTCNEAPPFKVNGHDVVLVSPALAKVTIRCPFPRARIAEEVPVEHQGFVSDQAQGVVNYLIREGFLGNQGNGVGVIVETEHS